MNKTELQQAQILREEIARACMIMEARKLYSQEEFKHFMSELRQYESEMVLTEGYDPETMYEGLLDRLKNLAKGMVNKVAPDNLQKIDQLAAQLADVDMDLDTAKEVGRTPNEIKALETKRNVLLQQLAKIDPNYAQQAQQAADAENSADPNAKKAQAGGDMKSKMQDTFKKAMDAADTPKADGILARIGNAFMQSHSAGHKANLALYGAVERGLNSLFRGNPAPQNQDDALMALLLKLQQAGLKIDPNKVEKETENLPEEPQEGGEEQEGMPKETPLSVMTRQKDVKPGKDGQKEAPLVMSIQKMGLSQPTAQQIAKRIGQYLRQRKIPIAESLNINHADRILENILKNAPKGLLYTLFEEISKEDMDEISAAAKSGDEKQKKDLYRKLSMKYHPDKGGEAKDFQRLKNLLGQGKGNTDKPQSKREREYTGTHRAMEKGLEDMEKLGLKFSPSDRTNLRKFFYDIHKNSKSGYTIFAKALARTVDKLENGDLSKEKVRLTLKGFSRIEDDVSSKDSPEKIIKTAFETERARIRAMSKNKGVIHKVVSRFISDNQNLLKKDPALKDIFDDEARFNQFAKKIRNNIKRMLKRRGYEDSEIGNLLESTNIEEQVREAANKYLLESDK